METLDQGFMNEYGQRISIQQEQAEAALKARSRAWVMPKGRSGSKRADQPYYCRQTVTAPSAKRKLNLALNKLPTRGSHSLFRNNRRSASPERTRPDPKAEQWAEKNSWFGNDEAMTFAAFGIHKKLIEDEGFDPQSDDYYNELDSRIKREFPHKFGEEQSTGRKPAQTVAGVSRSTKTGRSGKRVKLSQTQVAIAKKLGVPLEEYAKYVKE